MATWLYLHFSAKGSVDCVVALANSGLAGGPDRCVAFVMKRYRHIGQCGDVVNQPSCGGSLSSGDKKGANLMLDQPSTAVVSDRHCS